MTTQKTEPLMKIPIPNPKAIRNYFYEYVLIACTAAVVTLFFMLNDLNKYIRGNMDKEINNATNAIDKNSELLKQIISERHYFKGTFIDTSFINEK